MSRICAWCQLVLFKCEESDKVTHGICPDCYTAQMADLDKEHK